MGLRFGLGEAGIIRHLMPRGKQEPPPLAYRSLRDFLENLSSNNQDVFVSIDNEFAEHIRRIAQSALRDLKAIPEKSEYLGGASAARILQHLNAEFSQYDLYLMPVGSWQHEQELNKFAHQVARFPGCGILVLIPDFHSARENLVVFEPNSAVSDACKRRDLWPGVVVLLSTGESIFLSLDDASSRIAEFAAERHHAVGRVEQRELLRRMVTQPRSDGSKNPNRRLLHLSDLHFGTDRAAQTQQLLLSAIRERGEEINQVVITGDLFDQPRSSHAQHFRNFCLEIESMSIGRREPIVIPGNHDQRIFGNALLSVGRRLTEMVDLALEPRVVVIDELKLVFFCFDSSRRGTLARGRIEAKQLLRVGTEFDTRNKKGKYNSYAKVALVHHHPYRYGTSKEISILDPRGWRGREEFIELRGADQFLSWCSGRDVGLILHGHKHIPRLIRDEVSDGNVPPSYREITTVGCGSSLGAGGGPLSFNIVEWQPNKQMWTVDFQVSRMDGQGFKQVALYQYAAV